MIYKLIDNALLLFIRSKSVVSVAFVAIEKIFRRMHFTALPKKTERFKVNDLVCLKEKYRRFNSYHNLNSYSTLRVITVKENKTVNLLGIVVIPNIKSNGQTIFLPCKKVIDSVDTRWLTHIKKTK